MNCLTMNYATNKDTLAATIWQCCVLFPSNLPFCVFIKIIVQCHILVVRFYMFEATKDL